VTTDALSTGAIDGGVGVYRTGPENARAPNGGHSCIY